MTEREKGYYWVQDKKGNWEIYYDNGDGYWSGAEWEYVIPEKDIGEVGPKINSPSVCSHPSFIIIHDYMGIVALKCSQCGEEKPYTQENREPKE